MENKDGIYKIKIYFRTGNSFGKHSEEEVLDLSWNNLAIAKENLKAIKTHYTEVYHKIENSRGRVNNDEILNKYKNEWWFVVEEKPFSKKRDSAIHESDIKKYKAMNGDDDVYYRMIVHSSTTRIKLKTDK